LRLWRKVFEFLRFRIFGAMTSHVEAMHVDDPVTEPLDTGDKKPDVKPEEETKPDVVVVHEHLVAAADTSGLAPGVAARVAEAQVMVQAEEIIKADPQRRAAMAGILCDLVGDDCSAMSSTLKVRISFSTSSSLFYICAGYSCDMFLLPIGFGGESCCSGP
jgi:hypothetical protein